jgi:hypothetical protein
MRLSLPSLILHSAAAHTHSLITMASFSCRVLRHYKGQLYAKLFECRTPDTSELVVVYRALYGEHATWCRPRDMFVQPERFALQDDSRQIVLEQGTTVTHTETEKKYRVSLPNALDLA